MREAAVRERVDQRQGESARARLVGLRVEHEHAGPGLVELAPSEDHRVRVYASDAVSGRCHAESFLYRRGDVDLVPAGEGDRWEQDDAARCVVLTLAPSLLRRAAEDIGLDPDRAGVRSGHQLRDARIEHIAWALDAERAAGYPSGTLFAESLALGLAVRLLGAHGAEARTPPGLSRPQLAQLKAYIDEHLDRDLSLARLAAVSGLSMTHLKTLFRRSTGSSVHGYVIQQRVQRARALLQQTGLPAAQVALEAGFAHQSHMARCMKRVLGFTPSELTGRRRSRI